MKKMFVLLILAISTTTLTQAQNIVYDENAEVRPVSEFTGIEVSGSISLYLSQGAESAVAISAGEEKYNSKIKTEVRNGILRISVDGGLWNGMGWANRNLKAYVSTPVANSLGVSGASTVYISGILKADELKMDISGASEVKGAIEANQLKIDVSGASVARVTGKTKNLLVDASGACKVYSYDLVTDECKADASGASAIRVTVNNGLKASASGGAHIYYKGNPATINVSSSGGASIKKVISGDN